MEDAIARAGGLTTAAEPGDLNLAAPLADGAQIVVGDAKDPGGELRSTGGATSDGGSDTVNLNTATQQELETLPGVGPVTAAAIITWREASGPFTDVGQLDEVDGIGAATLARLEPLVSI